MQRYIAGHGAEAAGSIRHVQPGSPRDNPAAENLQLALERREGLQGCHTAVADHQVSFAPQDGRQQRWQIAGMVLIIGVSVDDQVSAQPQAGLQPGGEAGSQTHMMRQPQDMLHPAGCGNIGCAVTAAVVHHQHFHFIYAVQPARQFTDRLGQRFSFVVAGDLDDEFHIQA